MSDPSVQMMTHAMWIAEANALQKKELDELERSQMFVSNVFRASIRAFRETLIHLFGLHVGAGAKKPDDEITPFTPLIFFTSRPEFLDELLTKEKTQEKATKALDNSDLDAFNNQLSQIDIGDLEPIFTGANSADPFERWRSKEHQDLLRACGVTVVDDRPEEIREVDPIGVDVASPNDLAAAFEDEDGFIWRRKK